MLSRRPTEGGQQRKASVVVNEFEIAIHVATYPGVGGLLGPPDELGQFLVADPLLHLAIVQSADRAAHGPTVRAGRSNRAARDPAIRGLLEAIGQVRRRGQ